MAAAAGQVSLLPARVEGPCRRDQRGGQSVVRVVTEKASLLYLDLLKRTLSRSLFAENVVPVSPRPGSRKARAYAPVERLLASRGLTIARRINSADAFAESPPTYIRGAETLIGPVGLDNVQFCIEDVIRNDVPGDLVETGVWKGGAAIFMRGALEAFGDEKRVIWAADSFAGLPSPEQSSYPEDASEAHWASQDSFAIPLGAVKRNFARYGLLDDRVRFLVGWFQRPAARERPIEQLWLG